MFTTDGVEYDMPVVVLVSGNTYSSAEKLTALFQSTKRGTIVGTQTGGKGVYQDQIPLGDGTAVTLVQGYYYVNDVPNFHEIGITPDIVIDMDEALIGTDKDIQLKKAIELLS
jgi:carboxyl-terminal processing protease